MPSKSILDRLRAGDVILMDGGTGSELQRRGVNISGGATVKKRPTAPPKYASIQVPGVNYRSVTGVGVWSAPANVETPDIVRQVHEDYLKAGAEIIITNTFFIGIYPGISPEMRKYVCETVDNFLSQY